MQFVQLLSVSHSVQILSADGDPQPFIPADTDSTKGNTAAGAPENADNVIQAYKANVDVMAGLLLKLDQQGSSPQLAQQIRSAVLVSVRVHTTCMPLGKGHKSPKDICFSTLLPVLQIH